MDPDLVRDDVEEQLTKVELINFGLIRRNSAVRTCLSSRYVLGNSTLLRDTRSARQNPRADRDADGRAEVRESAGGERLV